VSRYAAIAREFDTASRKAAPVIPDARRKTPARGIRTRRLR
jgi:hypothetical protein